MPVEKDKGWFVKSFEKSVGITLSILSLIGTGYFIGYYHQSLRNDNEKNSRELKYQMDLQKQIYDCEKEKQEQKDKEIEELRIAYTLLQKKIDDQIQK